MMSDGKKHRWQIKLVVVPFAAGLLLCGVLIVVSTLVSEHRRPISRHFGVLIAESYFSLPPELRIEADDFSLLGPNDLSAGEEKLGVVADRMRGIVRGDMEVTNLPLYAFGVEVGQVRRGSVVWRVAPGSSTTVRFDRGLERQIGFWSNKTRAALYPRESSMDSLGELVDEVARMANRDGMFLGVKVRWWRVLLFVAGCVGGYVVFSSVIGRVRARRSVGLMKCARCGYCVVGLPRCPECGSVTSWIIAEGTEGIETDELKAEESAPRADVPKAGEVRNPSGATASSRRCR